MPSHMSAIGFEVETEQQFQEYASLALARGEAVKTGSGVYVKWAPGFGIELWAQGDNDKTFAGLNPHFTGGGMMQVRLTERLTRPDDSSLDGAFYGWAGPEDEGAAEGLFPLVFDCPDFDTHRQLVLPTLADVQLAAFAHSIDVYEDDDHFESSQDSDASFAPESFIPAGLFPSEDDSVQTPKSYAVFQGHVLAASLITNPATEREFHWALVKTLGGDIDVLADPQLVESEIHVGNVISGYFWLSGRLIEDAPKTKKSWFGLKRQ